MNTVTINAKADRKLKEEASKLADELGISLTIVINSALRRFVTERKIVIAEEYSPNEFLSGAILDAEKEFKAGQTTKTTNIQELSILIDNL